MYIELVDELILKLQIKIVILVIIQLQGISYRKLLWPTSATVHKFLMPSKSYNKNGIFHVFQVLRSGSISDESDTEPPSPPRPRRGRRQAVFDSKVREF